MITYLPTFDAAAILKEPYLVPIYYHIPTDTIATDEYITMICFDHKIMPLADVLQCLWDWHFHRYNWEAIGYL